jgi:hypothetical protein
MRAVSTVLDVGLALLLTTAAIGVLVAGPPLSTATIDGAPSARPAADLVATTTANVSYRVGKPADGDTRTEPRYAQGTLAALLVDAALRTVHLPGGDVGADQTGFERRLRNLTQTRLRPLAGGTNVSVAWQPVGPGGPHAGLAVGPTPPRDARVAAARLDVPTGIPRGSAAAKRAATGGYPAVAGVVATRLVAGLLPPTEMRTGLRGQPSTSERVRDRYEAFGGALGVEVGPVRESDDVTPANDALRRALRAQLAGGLAERHRSPAAAARTVRTGPATVTVRRWAA